MTLTVPTTADIRANLIAQFEAQLGQTVPLLPKSFIAVASAVIAAVYIILYKYTSFVSLQQFVATATINDTTFNGQTISPLKEWGRLIGVGDPIPAVAAVLEIDIVSTTTGTLPAGTQFLRQDTGVVYLLNAAVALVVGTVQGEITAVSDQAGGNGAGAQGNLQVSDTVSFVTPVTGVEPTATVALVVTSGVDAETEESYRQRIIDRFQKRPQGGAYADYEAWGEEPVEISNIYPYTSTNPGQVDVYAESSTEVDGIPTQAQLDLVAASIELDDAGLATRRPANALVNVFPITRTIFDVEIVNLIVDNLAEVQADLSEALTQYFLDREPFIFGISIPPSTNIITQSGVGGVVEDIVTAAAGIFSDVIVKQATITITQYSLGEGEKAKLGTLSYT